MGFGGEPLIEVPIPSCPPLEGPERRVSRIYADGLGRIRNCRPPFTCVPWSVVEPIPALWEEVPPLSFAPGADPCAVTIVASPAQTAATSVRPRGAPLASRLPRAPRQARTPRAPRALRSPRPPRSPRKPRTPRPPRKPRALRTSKRRPPRVRGIWICGYARLVPDGDWINVGHTGPWNEQDIDAYKVNNPHLRVFEWPEKIPCPTFGQSICAKAAALLVRPLQAALGWKRPEFPQPEELAEKRRAARLQRRTELRRRASEPAPAPSPTLDLAPRSRDICLTNTAFGWVDCYRDQGNGERFWSNHIHGPWFGTLPPPGSPARWGLGA